MIWSLRGEKKDLSRRGMVMGILNVTPDSFSDGGTALGVDQALDKAQMMMKQGAEIIDVGGESTRPGAQKVTLDQELDRVIPIVKALRAQSDCFISIDTSKSEVARLALEAGADIVNDVSGLRGDPDMVELCAKNKCAVVVMHMQGNPKTMQNNPRYEDVIEEVKSFFEERLLTLTAAGIQQEAICFDPGIGFGKKVEHNKQLLRQIDDLRVGDRPILIGASRKSIIGAVLEKQQINQRDWGTVAVTSLTRKQGAEIHRVHDVEKNLQAMRMIEAINWA